MSLSFDLNLVSFRCHANYFGATNSSFVAFVGPNSSGKTSLLEAIHLALTGESFRGNDPDMINHSASHAGVQLKLGQQIRQVKIIRHPQSKSMTIDQQNTPNRSEFRKGLGVVLFEPDDLRMLTGPAELRRRWLDRTIEAINPSYRQVLKHYNRALKQRNILLKKPINSEDQYFVWELKMSEYGANIIGCRKRLIELLNERITSNYRSISGANELFSVDYPCPETEDIGSWLAASFSRSRQHDTRLGHTSIGPHRDDFTVLKNKSPISQSGSRGEIRSTVLALKLFEATLIEEHNDSKPFILLDDVFSELDTARRLSLVRLFKDHQTFITTTEFDPVVGLEISPQIIEL